MDKIKMGKFLAELRIEKNLRQQDEAEVFEVSPQAISKWEAGDSVPDIGTLEKLSHFYNVGIDEIINGERKKNEAPTTNTLVVARNPTMEEKGIGKPFYGAFIYGMSSLFLAFILAFIPYLNISSGGYGTQFTFYQILFNSNGWPVVFVWFAAITFLPSALLTIGLWLDKNHRRQYWWACFWCNLSQMIFLLVFTVLVTIAGMNTSGSAPMAGYFLFGIFTIAYFVLFLTLPITRKRTYIPNRMIVSDPVETK
jgi:transcriptional regulator with XRE-family HTH domain